jgi:hypothetical protein
MVSLQCRANPRAGGVEPALDGAFGGSEGFGQLWDAESINIEQVEERADLGVGCTEDFANQNAII